MCFDVLKPDLIKTLTFWWLQKERTKIKFSTSLLARMQLHFYRHEYTKLLQPGIMSMWNQSCQSFNLIDIFLPSWTAVLQWSDSGALENRLLYGRDHENQHYTYSSILSLILKTPLQSYRGCLPQERKKIHNTFISLFLRRVSLVETDAKIVNSPTDCSYDFTETCYYSYAMCSCFLSPCSWLCTSDIRSCSCFILLAFYSEASLLITEEEKRSLPHMLEKVKGCSPTPASLRLYKSSVTFHSGSLCTS